MRGNQRNLSISTEICETKINEFINNEYSKGYLIPIPIEIIHEIPSAEV